jgi:hypothetical protein
LFKTHLRDSCINGLNRLSLADRSTNNFAKISNSGMNNLIKSENKSKPLPKFIQSLRKRKFISKNTDPNGVNVNYEHLIHESNIRKQVNEMVKRNIIFMIMAMTIAVSIIEYDIERALKANYFNSILDYAKKSNRDIDLNMNTHILLNYSYQKISLTLYNQTLQSF